LAQSQGLRVWTRVLRRRTSSKLLANGILTLFIASALFVMLCVACKPSKCRFLGFAVNFQETALARIRANLCGLHPWKTVIGTWNIVRMLTFNLLAFFRISKLLGVIDFVCKSRHLPL
jgi:hypothetical protein